MEQSCTLDYGCSAWRISSQNSANAYRNGLKLWTPDCLRDIEQQLAESKHREAFMIRSIHGREILIKNPGFREDNPIWRPFVKFREYWWLARDQSSGPVETYDCSYLVDWTNLSARELRFALDDPATNFKQANDVWHKSQSCQMLRETLDSMLATKKTTKVICFGLGDMSLGHPDCMKSEDPGHAARRTREVVRHSTFQHAMTMTVAEACGGSNIQILAQDPDYSEQTQRLLALYGISTVGHFGAGGFAEIDDSAVVVSAFVNAPLKQIIADIARPPLLISTGRGFFSDSRTPWADADSPRTQEMWQDYNISNFPTSSFDDQLLTDSMCGLVIFDRKDA